MNNTIANKKSIVKSLEIQIDEKEKELKELRYVLAGVNAEMVKLLEQK
jgi:hypothetical protein